MGAGVARLAGQTGFEDHHLVKPPFFCFGLPATVTATASRFITGPELRV